jgi:hypothetical protein
VEDFLPIIRKTGFPSGILDLGGGADCPGGGSFGNAESFLISAMLVAWTLNADLKKFGLSAKMRSKGLFVALLPCCLITVYACDYIFMNSKVLYIANYELNSR